MMNLSPHWLFTLIVCAPITLEIPEMTGTNKLEINIFFFVVVGDLIFGVIIRVVEIFFLCSFGPYVEKKDDVRRQQRGYLSHYCFALVCGSGLRRDDYRWVWAHEQSPQQISTAHVEYNQNHFPSGRGDEERVKGGRTYFRPAQPQVVMLGGCVSCRV